MNFHIFILALLVSSSGFSQQSLEIPKTKNLPDQAVGQYILTEAYDYLGIDLKFTEVPAQRALVLSNSGKMDGEIQRLAIVEKLAPNLIRVPTAVSYVEATIFSPKKLTFTGTPMLKDYSYVYMRGVPVNEQIKVDFKKSSMVNESIQTFRFLKAGRADMTIAGRITGAVQLKQAGIEGIYALQPPYKRYVMYHYLHKKHKALVPKIDRVLSKLSKNGELARLRAVAVDRLLNDKNEASAK